MAKLKTDKKNLLIFPLLLFVWLLVKLGDFGIKTTKFIFSSSLKILPVKTIKAKTKKFTKKTTKKKKYSYIDRFSKTMSFILPKRLRWGIFTLTFGFLFISYTYLLIDIASDIPSPNNLRTLPTPTTTEFYDRNGVLLYRFYEGKNRTPVKLSDLPPYLIQASIAMEDKNFYHHPGIDITGIIRAAVVFLQDQQVQGGSTITQQLIKNTLLTPERTIERKTKEIILAFWTERIFSKDEILEMYFNEVPFGGTAWGIAAAAQTYFNKQASDLNLAEAAYLAGLPASPTTYSPYGTNPELAKVRQRLVLNRMVTQGYISESQADQAYNEKLNIHEPLNEIHAPHFVMYIRNQLTEKYGQRFVSQGGLKVYTTLDLELQNKAQEIVAQEVDKIKYLRVTNGAAMITNAKNGQILAMVGSKNYWEEGSGKFNVASAPRQPGSSIKPITYATAFKLGYSPGNIILDTPVTYKNFWETYKPVNYDGRYHGAVTLRTALGSSYNIPAVKLLNTVTIPEFLKTATDLGITTFNDPSRFGLSVTLGGGEVTMVDMMSVYGTFSQNGQKYQIKGVTKITDSKGNLIEDNTKDAGVNVLQPAIAFMINDILSDNTARTPAFGSNSLLNIPGKTVAVKTGTTDNKRDNWTIGYSPEYVVGVWVGNNNNTPMHPSLASGVTGAAPIWNKIMTEVLKDRLNLAFEKPGGITTALVDGRRDIVIAGLPSKSLLSQNRQIVRNEQNGEEKETITFTDPLSVYQSDQSGQPIQISP